MSYLIRKKLIAIATLSTAALAPAQDTLLEDIIAYYPLDVLEGISTPDLVNGYTIAGSAMTSDVVVTGRFGNAFNFNGTNQILTRAHPFDTSGELPLPLSELPLEQHTNFSISLWVNGTGGMGNADRRIIGEGSLSATDILFGFGTAPGTANPDKVDVFIRAAGNAESGGIQIPHSVSSSSAFDGTWHHILFVQEGPDAKVYIDGTLQTFTNGDPDDTEPLIRSTTPIRPLDSTTGQPFTNVTAIGGIQRTSASNLFQGMIDEVGMWSRALTAEEATRLSQEKIPDPNVVLPISLTSFTSERPTSAAGGTAILSWQGSAGDTYTLNPGAMDVSGSTAGGVGTIAVPITEATTYELTVSRAGAESITLTTDVGVLPDVAEGWALLGNFETFNLGKVATEGNPFWSNPENSNRWDFVDFLGNKVATSASGVGGPMISPLGTYAIEAGATRTLFFHVFSPITTDTAIFRMGATSKILRGLTNDLVSEPVGEGGINGGYLGAYLDFQAGNGGSSSGFLSVEDISSVGNTAGKWIAVWLEVTNRESGEFDVSSLYTQVSDSSERTLNFENSTGDSLDSSASLETFYVGGRDGNDGDQIFFIDNIFVSEETTTLGSTPVEFPPAPAIPVDVTPLLITSASFEAGMVTIEWNGDSAAFYTIERSTNLTDWEELDTNATGNSFSNEPPAEATKIFYRVSLPN